MVIQNILALCVRDAITWCQFSTTFVAIGPDRTLTKFSGGPVALFSLCARQLELSLRKMHPTVTISGEHGIFRVNLCRLFFCTEFMADLCSVKRIRYLWTFCIDVLEGFAVAASFFVQEPGNCSNYNPWDHFQAICVRQARFEGASISCRSNGSTNAQASL